MKIKKKIKFIPLIFCIMFVSMWFAGVVWEGIISDFVPWTRTWFPSHQSYIELLQDNHCFGNVFFKKDISDNSGKTKYYWHRHMVNKTAAYSTMLAEQDYETIAESRKELYFQKTSEDESAIIYIMSEDKKDYIEASEWYEEELNFIDKVIQNQEAEQEYYYLIVTRYYTINGTSYNGVILNDTTRELVEFCVEMGDEDN